MSQRDSGWIQLYAESNQEAVDLHVQAYRLAEALSLPVMVCMDGFVLTHAYERVELPEQDAVDAFLPPFEPRQVLDPADPVTIGAMVGPEAFTEVRYLMHAKQMQALDAIPAIADEFAQAFGRQSGGLLRRYRSEDAETVVVALGSVLGTIEDGRRRAARRRRAHRRARDQVASGRGRSTRCARRSRTRRGSWWSSRRSRSAPAASSARTCGSRSPACRRSSTTSSPGSAGGRSRSARCARSCSTRSPASSQPNRLTFLDLDTGVVERELERPERAPHAENILRDLGVLARPY